jgi:hypothetical protein
MVKNTLISLDVSLNDLGNIFLQDFVMDIDRLLELKMQGCYDDIHSFTLARIIYKHYKETRPLNMHMVEPSFCLPPQVMTYHREYFIEENLDLKSTQKLLNLSY